MVNQFHPFTLPTFNNIGQTDRCRPRLFRAFPVLSLSDVLSDTDSRCGTVLDSGMLADHPIEAEGGAVPFLCAFQASDTDPGCWRSLAPRIHAKSTIPNYSLSPPSRCSRGPSPSPDCPLFRLLGRHRARIDVVPKFGFREALATVTVTHVDRMAPALSAFPTPPDAAIPDVAAKKVRNIPHLRISGWILHKCAPPFQNANAPSPAASIAVPVGTRDFWP